MDLESLPKASSTFLSTAPASPTAQRYALAIVITLFVAFCALIQFDNVRLRHIAAFVPIFDSIVAVSNLVTAGLLLVGYRRSRLGSVLGLAGGYLFGSLLAVAHLLTFRDLFTASELIAASRQSGAWLGTFRSTGFPCFVICYALLKRRVTAGGKTRADPRICMISVAGCIVAGVCLLFLLATVGHALLPQIDNAVGVPALLLSLAALLLLGSWFPYSILDLWLLAVICAWIPEVTLSILMNESGADLIFAGGRLYDVFAAVILPGVLIFEASRLADRLDAAIALAEERNAQLVTSRQELAQAQRLEAVGQLTGGIAHDFNNLLTVIIGNLELIKRADADADKIKRFTQAAMKAALRGEHLVRQLLTYARKQINRPQIVNINELIVNVESLTHRVIGEQIEVVTILSPILAPVAIDPAQFETALLNLAINSRDAMADGGRLTIKTENMVVHQPPANTPEIPPGHYVVITVSDTGAGMPPGVLARAFDPFFTTKEVGKGSGLGLSQVYGFAMTAGGRVTINSELSAGTTVKLYLPRSSDQASLSEPKAEAAPRQPASGRGTILVVEDDQEVLAVTAENLRDLGYRVMTVANAMQALEILGSEQPIDLLFTDVVMPGDMNGAQLAIRARHIRPDLRVLLTSGHTAAALSREHALPDDLDVVAKPYRREELAQKISRVLTA
jgi:signal transduction histidine kinase/CheY-like chemotaxis protein